MGHISRRTLVAGLLGAAGAALASCSRQPGSGAPGAAPSAASTPVAPTPTRTPGTSATRTLPDARPRWPLTGRLLAEGDDARHPAVAVKVPDGRAEHPQVGLESADLVFVELAGDPAPANFGGTRLVPVFHSRLPDAVAPVRSLRPVDVDILSPLRAVLGHTGGAGTVVDLVARHGAYLVSELSYAGTRGTDAYSIDGSRVYRLHGTTHYDRAVVCHPRVLASLTDRFAAGPPVPYLPWTTADAPPSAADAPPSAADAPPSAADAPPSAADARPSTASGPPSTADAPPRTASGRPARTIAVPWLPDDTWTSGYAWDAASGRYLRSTPWGPHLLADGSRVAVDNVLVIRSAHRHARVGGVGPHEPIHDVAGATGPFHYANGGRCVTGRWAKGAAQEPFAFTLADGTPLRVAPGTTWIELASRDAVVRVGA